MIKAIIFDFFGLFTTDAWKVFCEELPPGPGVERARELNRMYDAALISHPDFVSQVMETTGASSARIEEAQLGGTVIDKHLISYITELKQRGFKTAILSNVGTNQILDSLLTKDEQKLFDAFVFSYQVGAVKPDAKIYQIALEKLQVKPKEAVFTDDGPRNVEGAKALGISAIFYQDLNQFKAELEKVLAANPN